MRDVTSEEVAAYLDLVNSLADSLVGIAGAEKDDLVQEGLISVWRALSKGVQPSAKIIRLRMLTWCRWLSRQIPVDYEEMLPLDNES